MSEHLWTQCAFKYHKRGGEYIPVIRTDDGGEQEVVWAPQPGSQPVFLDCDDIEVLLEGNRGGGKTDTLLMDFYREVGQGWGADWVGVLFRQTHPMLRDVIEKSKKWFKRLCPDAFYNEIKFFWEFPTGERLYLSHFNQSSDFDAYLGHSYTWIAWEELTRWPTEDFYLQMFSCLRSARPGIPKRIRATTNPSGPGHSWVKSRFGLVGWPRPGVILGPRIAGGLNKVTNMPEPPRRAIHSDLKENQILLNSDPNYLANVSASARNEAERQAWVNGSWDIAAGGMFSDVWADAGTYCQIADFVVPENWIMYRALDYGSAKPFSIGFYAVSDGSDFQLSDGKWRSSLRGDRFRVGEIYGAINEKNEGMRLTVGKITEMIIKYEIQMGWRDLQSGRTRVKPGPADTGIFDDRDGLPSIASDFEKSVTIGGIKYRGIRWEHADKGPGSREQGWEQIRKRIEAAKPVDRLRERQALFICNRCYHWLRTVINLPRDEKKPDDVDTESEDHVGDETRYALRFEPFWGKSGRI